MIKNCDLGVELYTKKEIAGILGVTYTTVSTYIRNGSLTATKVGGRWYVEKKDLLKFLNGAQSCVSD